jgi:hypothetical protein
MNEEYPMNADERDAEVAAMQAIVNALAPFDREPPGPVERILRWACDRYCVRQS